MWQPELVISLLTLLSGVRANVLFQSVKKCVSLFGRTSFGPERRGLHPPPRTGRNTAAIIHADILWKVMLVVKTSMNFILFFLTPGLLFFFFFADLMCNANIFKSLDTASHAQKQAEKANCAHQFPAPLHDEIADAHHYTMDYVSPSSRGWRGGVSSIAEAINNHWRLLGVVAHTAWLMSQPLLNGV